MRGVVSGICLWSLMLKVKTQHLLVVSASNYESKFLQILGDCVLHSTIQKGISKMLLKSVLCQTAHFYKIIWVLTYNHIFLCLAKMLNPLPQLQFALPPKCWILMDYCQNDCEYLFSILCIQTIYHL